MADVFTTDKAQVIPFICGLAGLTRECLADPTCIGLLRDGRLIGGVLYEGYTGPGGSVEMHVAGVGRTWLTRRMLRLAFHYPFTQLECKVIYGRVPSWKPEALRLDLKLGFTLEYVMKDAAPQGDYYLVAMREAQCRFLEI